jgi:hypothetical protein
LLNNSTARLDAAVLLLALTGLLAEDNPLFAAA